jgi:hypothetical protein
LELSRSLHLPVWQLEGLTGTARFQRGRLLARTIETPAKWLTGGSLGLATAFFCGLLSLGWLCAPETAGLAPTTLLEGILEGTASWGAVAWFATCHLAATAMVEPLYVAGGFSLYINRRTHLEGWDIEVAFRRLARRLTHRDRTAPVLGPLVALVLCLLAGGPAAALDADESVPAEPAVVIEQVLADEDFGASEVQTRWGWPWLEELQDSDDDPLSCAPDSSDVAHGSSGPSLARTIELLLWLVVGLVVALLGVWLKRQLLSPRWQGMAAADPVLPDLILGHDALPDKLPDDIPEAAWRLWETGDHARSLGMLYAGALVDLVTRHGLDIPRGATEGDCVDAVQARQGGTVAAYFAQLTRAWLQTAYAHRAPSADQFRALVDGWPEHFMGKAS